MTADRVRRLLERGIGLDPESLGPNVLPSVLADRCRLLGVSAAAYALRLEADPGEFQALVVRLVVPETWFFRGPGLFEHLARHVAGAAGPVRALSLPCSTGEEPYSLAIALAEVGAAADRCTIDAVDASAAALAAAGRGVYSDFSFRLAPPWLKERYFRASSDGWELDAAIRSRVRFRNGNLLDPDTLPPGRFDIVMCRNLLIYLTSEARCRAAGVLDRLLARDGLLVVGHAEPRCLPEELFSSGGPNGLFLFARTAVPPVRPERQVEWRPAAASDFPSGGRKSSESLALGGLTPRGQKPVKPVSTSPIAHEPPLARARRLADAGQLAEALSVCEAAVAAAPSADAFALLGVIRQARGELDPATAAFRRALYLDPNHREALAHAMLLSRADGNEAQAAAYQARLARVVPGGDT